jgi:hypothetical protein
MQRRLPPRRAPWSPVREPPRPGERSGTGSALLPADKKRIDTEGRRERLRVLYEHFLTIPELKGNVRPPFGKSKPRMYLEEDHSYLYFDEWGGLHAGIKGGDRQTCKAQQAIDTYELRNIL